MATICNTYYNEIKSVETPAGTFRLITDVITDGKVVFQAYNKTVDTREKAMAIRKALRDTGWDKHATFSKEKVYAGISFYPKYHIVYEQKYVVAAIHHF